jgi:hypothetical protein
MNRVVVHATGVRELQSNNTRGNRLLQLVGECSSSLLASKADSLEKEAHERHLTNRAKLQPEEEGAPFGHISILKLQGEYFRSSHVD